MLKRLKNYSKILFFLIPKLITISEGKAENLKEKNYLKEVGARNIIIQEKLVYHVKQKIKK